MSLVFHLLIFSAFLSLSSSGQARSEIEIAVLPVEVNSSAEAGYLQQGVADMLSARLAQHEGLGVIRIEDLESATNDLENAQATGRALGVDYVVFGSLTRFGEGASLDLVCARVSGTEGTDPRGVFVQSGDLTSIIPQLDPVVTRIAFYINAGPKAADTALNQPTIRDALDQIDALKARLNSLENEMALSLETPVSEESPAAPFSEELKALQSGGNEGETEELR